MNASNSYSKRPSVSLPPSTTIDDGSNTTNHHLPQQPPPHKPLHLVLQESILHLNAEGVRLLSQHGDTTGAMRCFGGCLEWMKMVGSVGRDKIVHCRFAPACQQPPKQSLDGGTTLRQGYVFAAPLEIVSLHTIYREDEDRITCKLLSLVLFNMSLARHWYGIQLEQSTNPRNESSDAPSQDEESMGTFFDNSLRLYELCHASLVFTSSGCLCSDLAIAVVVTNNIGEIHRELHRRRNGSVLGHKHGQTVRACSERLIQTFMFFAANGSGSGMPNQLQGLGDVLDNAMEAIHGTTGFAPAA